MLSVPNAAYEPAFSEVGGLNSTRLAGQTASQRGDSRISAQARLLFRPHYWWSTARCVRRFLFDMLFNLVRDASILVSVLLVGGRLM